ncbi:MAG: copper resistance protein B [Microcoleaceae cyanobacterium]
MKNNSTDYRFTLTGLLSLISVLAYAPAVRAGELLQFKTEVNIKTINNLEVDNSDTPPENKWLNSTKSFSINEFIEPTVKFVSYEQWQLSQSHNQTSENVDEEKWPEPVEDSQTFWLLLVDQLEFRTNDGEDTFNWDALSWVGGDYQKLWIKTEGDIGLESGDGEAELQLLYGKLIAPYWDFQAGIKYDQVYSSDGGPGRASGVIGIQGLAPYFFEVDAAIFVSQDGDVSGRLQTEYQLLLSQRLILQPEFETNIAIQQVEEFGVGSGINDIELGLRLRYEFSRQFAPYIGINWTHKFGETAELAEEEDESTDNFSFVGGLRLLF